MNNDEKICPRCAETIKRAAVVCRYCGHEFANVPAPTASAITEPQPQQPANWRPDRSKALADVPGSTRDDWRKQLGKIGGIGCLGFLILAVIGAIAGGGSTGNSTGTKVANLTAANLVVNDMNVVDMNAVDMNATNVAAEPETPSGGWTVRTSEDEVRGKTIYFAQATSENEANFDFPYAGGSSLTMTVRRHPKYGDDVYFHISSGQFVCGVEDCSGTINYGDGPRTITLVEPDDASSDTLFAANGAAVISNLKKADRVIVELPFYQEGNRQFTFDTKGLVWPPKG